MSRSNDIAGLTTSILDGVTATEVGLGNVTNESKATMFASPTFTGTTNVSSGVTLPSNPTIVLGSNTTFPVEHHFYTSGFSNSWQTYNWSNATTVEEGVRIRRMGPIYVVDMSIYKSTLGLGDYHEKVLDLGTDITHPTNFTFLGNNTWHNATQRERVLLPYINTSGEFYLRGTNDAGGGVYLTISIMGIDVA